MTTRHTVLATVLVAGLLLLPGLALGQADETATTEERAAPSFFTSTSSGIYGYQRPDGYVQISGDASASDARASGRFVMVATYEEAPAGDPDPESAVEVMVARYTGFGRLENDDGAWQGPTYGVIYPDGTEVNYNWFTGEGAYEGLFLFGSYDGPVDDPGRQERGMIWAGPPPAVPDVSLLSD